MESAHSTTCTNGRNFTNVSWDTEGAKTARETSNETADDEHAFVDGSAHKDSANDPAKGVYKNGFFTAELCLDNTAGDATDKTTDTKGRDSKAPIVILKSTRTIT